MIDASLAAAPPVVCRADYRPPDWLVPQVDLCFRLDAERTLVTALLKVRRNGAHKSPLRLDIEDVELLSLEVDGIPASAIAETGALKIAISGDSATLAIEVALDPRANSRLMGLYESGGILCTQCEAEGFRRIIPFPDRPDILSLYAVRIEASRALYPVLLSNGDPIGAGMLEAGRHWAEWRDPFPKPCYLFALVAGDLKARRDRFITGEKRTVDLAIWVREADLPRTEHAMESLKAAMKWDEKAYGRHYDLAAFNIVAVDDFNFGAMENKGLNIFNSRYVLVDPETATDADHDAVTAVIGHEYFHNWSGNRVTCRDWFQLSLKEGFTVYRDQSFSGDLGSPALKRIEDVRALRAAQFPEDAGPLAHPVRPDSYMEISNFYTATVYSKGAELIRMLHTLLGAEGFRAGTDLYFSRHDGQAVTCEDFVRALEEASDMDLSRFRRWYEQAGTPRVRFTLSPAPGGTGLRLEQRIPPTPGQPDKKPMPIPLRVALFDSGSGEQLDERLILLETRSEEITLPASNGRPVLSLNRGFSAPIIVESDASAADLAFLAAHDDDPFGRYEALQQLMLLHLLRVAAGEDSSPDAVIAAVEATIADPGLDPAFIADSVSVPSEAYIGDQMEVVDPEAIHAARETLRGRIGRALESEWRKHAAGGGESYTLAPSAKAARRIRGVAWSFLAASGAEDAPALLFEAYRNASNMTERQAALNILAQGEAPERVAALDDFYERYRGDSLVIDKWFTIQAASSRSDTLARVEELYRHRDFRLDNPNRLRALAGTFGANQRALHSEEGRGYVFLADAILAVDPINPQVAARLLGPLGRWRRFSPEPGRRMRSELERILVVPGLSKDVAEQAGKSLE